MTPEQFAQRMFADAEIVSRTIPQQMEALVVSVAGVVAPDTPIKTGRAQSGWNASKGTSRGGEPHTTTQSRSTPVRNVETDVRGLRLGEPAYLNNSVPYIGLLNDGSSDQAPKMFIELGIQAGVTQIEIDPLRDLPRG